MKVGLCRVVGEIAEVYIYIFTVAMSRNHGGRGLPIAYAGSKGRGRSPGYFRCCIRVTCDG